jgi:protein disulfide-isomerase A1
MELTDDTFDEALARPGEMLVEFYAPWCGHCQEFEPKYSRFGRLAQVDEEIGAEFLVAKVDTTKNDVLKDRFGVTGYPTLKLFLTDDVTVKGTDHDVVITYTGERSLADLRQFVKAYTSLMPVLQNSGEAVRNFIQDTLREKSHALVGYFDTKDNPAVKALQGIAKQVAREVGVRSALVYHEAMAASKMGLRLHVRFEQSAEPPWFPCSSTRSAVPDGWDEDEDSKWTGEDWNSTQIAEMTRFIKARTLPQLTFYGKAGQIATTFERGIQAILLVFADLGAVSSYEAELRSAAQVYPGQLNFMVVPMYETKVLKTFGVVDQKDGQPVVKLLDARVSVARIKRFGYDGVGALNAEALIDYQERFFRGELDAAGLREYKSKDPVKNAPRELVPEIVGSTFLQTVLANRTDDILVMYFAPWCKYCAKFINDFRLMAKNFKQVPTLSFMKMDDTQNEVDFENYTAIAEVPSYPTFYMFGGEQRTPMKYSGPLKYKDIEEWLNESVMTPFELDGVSYGNAVACSV